MKLTLICSILIGFSSSVFAQNPPQPTFSNEATIGLWEQLGVDIDGEAPFDGSGKSVSLSADSLTVAIGAPSNQENDSLSTDSANFTDTQAIVITVASENEAPSITPLEDIYISVNGSDTVEFLLADEEEGNLTISATSSNQSLIPNSSLNLTSFDTSYSLLIVPVEEQFGTTTITITVSDGVNTVIESFVVAVENQAPRLNFTGETYNGLWEQLGLDIDGREDDVQFGYSVSISDDGLTVALSARLAYTQIYRFDIITNTWVQLGADIIEEDSVSTVSLSADGLTVAVDTRSFIDPDVTKVYHYNDTNDQWEQLGSDILKESIPSGANSTNIGRSISMSADGFTIAVAELTDDNPTFKSFIRIYHFDNSLNQWGQLGESIEREIGRRALYYSVELSSDGRSVAFGALDSVAGRNTQVYRYNDVINQWEQFGTDIQITTSGDNFFTYSFSSDALTLAVADPDSTGRTQIFRYNVSTNNWEQLGENIDGETRSDQSGSSISLSADGHTIAIGAFRDDANGRESGHTRFFAYNEFSNSWEQLGKNVDGERPGDRSGISIALSASGETAVIGANLNGGNGNNSGHTRIYRYISTQGYTITEQTTAVTDVTAIDDLDFEGSGLIYSLNGVDAGIFSVSSTGFISFTTAPVFANPLDLDRDNIYNITVTVTDSGGLSTSEDIEITVVQMARVTPITTTTLPDGSIVFQVPSISGATYAVEYSQDMQVWETVETEIEATGNSIEWTDNGLPDTPTHPNVTEKRFYRFRLLSTP